MFKLFAQRPCLQWPRSLLDVLLAEHIQCETSVGPQGAGYRASYVRQAIWVPSARCYFYGEGITGSPLAFDGIVSAAGRVATEQLPAVAGHSDVPHEAPP